MTVWIFFFSVALTAPNSPELNIHFSRFLYLWYYISAPLLESPLSFSHNLRLVFLCSLPRSPQIKFVHLESYFEFLGILCTFKLGNKKLFDQEQIGIKEPFPVTFCHLLLMDKELLVLRNNFRATKKFLIAKFDCIIEEVVGEICKKFKSLILKPPSNLVIVVNTF